MDRDIPNYNPIVVGRMQQKQLQLHHQRLQNIKSFNQSRVTTSAHHQSRHNKKALQLQQDKKTEIERHNLILFNKMLKIMKRTDQNNRTPSAVNRVNARTSVELTRIQQQNRTMYERIEKQKPTIDNRKLYQQRKKQQNILKFLGKYSAHAMQNAQTHSMRYDYAITRQSGVNRANKLDHYLQKLQHEHMNLEKAVRYQQNQQNEELDEEQFSSQAMGHNNRSKKSYSTNYTSNQIANKPDMAARRLDDRRENEKRVPSSAKDIILFKCTKQISGTAYEVKIVRSHVAYQIRAITVSQAIQDPSTLVLSQHAGQQLLELNDYHYSTIVSKLAIRNNQLVLNQAQQHQNNDQDQQGPHLDQSHTRQFRRNAPQQFSRNMQKPMHMNPSHISEQNEEDSYRHADSIGYSPAKYSKRVDSLGPQQKDNICLQQEESSDRANEVDNVCMGYEVYGKKHKGHKEQDKQEGQLEQKQQLRLGVVESNYEQALEEEIV